MSILKRYFDKGQLYFVTIVTYQRNNILIDNYQLYIMAISRIKKKHKFEIIAFVVMPDHLHIIINPYETKLSDIIHDFKLSFNGQFRRRYDKHRGHLWQGRFWDHIIRDQDDLNKHIDYIHYNPVKHGLSRNPFEWNMSSINKFKNDGFYQGDWCVNEEINIEGDFGE